MNVTLGARPVSVLGEVGALDERTRAQRAATRVALVNMPFVTAHRPSLQLGLLKPIAASHGFDVETFHLNVEFAGQIGPAQFETLAAHRGPLVGDWLFSLSAYGADAPDPDGRMLDDMTVDMYAAVREGAVSRQRLRELRQIEVPQFIERMVDGVDWSRFTVVGFTTTFQQSVASFALAAELKRRWPHLVTLFGGSNFDGAMGRELTRAVPAVDYAITGEADVSISQFLIAISAGTDPLRVPGVLRRDENGELAEGPEPQPFERLDELPMPDYDEYFATAERCGVVSRAGRRIVGLPYESARGCWWGAKRQCTFCGLNGSTMSFRAKSPTRVADELADLAERYGSYTMFAVDNIVEPTYTDELFPALQRDEASYQLFYEVKANLTRDQLRTMRGAGVTSIQPGIESLSSRVLGLMRKGTRASTNVNLLRWARHYRIAVSWNLLWGFPGESVEDYAQQAELMRALFHLEPPSGGGRIWMERFSPIFEDRQGFPARSVRPNASYSYIHPASVDLGEIAYFFEYELDNTLPDDAYLPVLDAIQAWGDSAKGDDVPTLRAWRSPGMLHLDDGRDLAAPVTYRFSGALAELYWACFQHPLSAAKARAAAGLDEVSDEQAEAALDQFVARRLMMRDGNLFLALALPASGPMGDLS